MTLGKMWEEKKNYVVVVDHDLYDRLAPRLGGNKCVYDASEGVSGGYAGEHRSVSYEAGKSSSTNLWNGILGELGCEFKLFARCDYGRNGLQSPDTVRRATEKILLDRFKEGHKSLHETSYIWAYGDFAGFGDVQAANFRFDANDSSLVAATDDRRLLINDGILKNTYVNAGLKPFAKNFIDRLKDEADLKKTGVGVGVVNMDAIGRDNTFDEFISPLLVIDRQILTR